MSPRAPFAGCALAALLAGCAPHPDGDSGQPTSAWVEVGVTQFQSDGETGSVAIPA